MDRPEHDTRNLTLPQPSIAGARVLVVDDNQPVRVVVRRYLTRADAVCSEACDGAEAIAVAQRERLDVVLMDIDMPVLDGLEACRRLRQDPATARLPVVFLTGRDDDQRHVEALRAGGDDFMAKPFAAPVLIARLANLVSRYRAEQENTRLLELLRRYVSVPLREAALGDGDGRRPVEHVTATILFSDLRGFTSTTEQQSAEQVFRAISDVLAQQTEIVLAHHGYVDKFSGDGMLAVFEGADCAHDACLAARAIVQWARSYAGIAFWNPPPIGFGIHHGDFLRGDLGGEKQLEFTVIGGTVNVAARLCGVAKALEVVVSDEVAQRIAGRLAVGEQRRVSLKGLSEAAAVHMLVVE